MQIVGCLKSPPQIYCNFVNLLRLINNYEIHVLTASCSNLFPFEDTWVSRFRYFHVEGDSWTLIHDIHYLLGSSFKFCWMVYWFTSGVSGVLQASILAPSVR